MKQGETKTGKNPLRPVRPAGQRRAGGDADAAQQRPRRGGDHSRGSGFAFSKFDETCKSTNANSSRFLKKKKENKAEKHTHKGPA